MKKIIRNLFILNGVIGGAILVRSTIHSKLQKEGNKKNQNHYFCTWEEFERKTGYHPKKVKEKIL